MIRDSLLKEFKKKVVEDEKSKQFLSEKFLLDDAYLHIFLRFIQCKIFILLIITISRAGEWNIERALDILSKFHDLGVNYKKYVEKSIPSL